MHTHPPIHAPGCQKPHPFPAAQPLQFVNHKPRMPEEDTPRPQGLIPPTSGPGRVHGATPPLCCFTANQGRRPGLGAGAYASTKGRKCKESPAL